MGTEAKLEHRWSHWASTACILLLLLTVGVQAMHVHAYESASGTPCLACVSAHSNVPVASAVTTVMLVALSSVTIVAEISAPSFEAVLPLFIRPPPSV